MPFFPDLDQTLDAVLRGQSDEFLAIVRAHGPGLRTFLATQLFHLDEVDDLAQETFIAAYRSLHTFRRGEDFGAWLRGIARHKLLRHFEQMSRRREVHESFGREVAPLIAAELDEAARRTEAVQLQAMLSCISRLPERMRTVVRTWLDGGRAGVLAAELGTTPGALYQLQYRALTLLRSCVSREVAHGG